MFEHIKLGDKIYYRRMNFLLLPFWEIVTVTRTTKTLIIIGDMRFKKTEVDLYEINDETKREAERDNRIFIQYLHGCDYYECDYYNYNF